MFYSTRHNRMIHMITMIDFTDKIGQIAVVSWMEPTLTQQIAPITFNATLGFQLYSPVLKT